MFNGCINWFLFDSLAHEFWVSVMQQPFIEGGYFISIKLLSPEFLSRKGWSTPLMR